MMSVGTLPCNETWRGLPEGAEHAASDGLPPPPPMPLQPRGSEDTERTVFRPVPNVGGGDRNWNLEKCRIGRKCDDPHCKDYHSDSERRCSNWLQGLCQNNQGGARCIMGLHVNVSDVNLTYTVDLESPIDCATKLRALDAQHPDECAKYVRIIVFGFATVREKLLKKFLEAMPLLHEMVLPDLPREPSLLVFLCDVVGTCAKSNPRLRDIIFEDGREENLW